MGREMFVTGELQMFLYMGNLRLKYMQINWPSPINLSLMNVIVIIVVVVVVVMLFLGTWMHVFSAQITEGHLPVELQR